MFGVVAGESGRGGLVFLPEIRTALHNMCSQKYEWKDNLAVYKCYFVLYLKFQMLNTLYMDYIYWAP